jgi:hypothetical protein
MAKRKQVKVLKSNKQKRKARAKMAKAKKAKSSSTPKGGAAPKLNSNFMYGTMPNASAPKAAAKGKKK